MLENIFKINAVILLQLTHLHTKIDMCAKCEVEEKVQIKSTEKREYKTVKNFVYVFQYGRSCVRSSFSWIFYEFFFLLLSVVYEKSFG